MLKILGTIVLLACSACASTDKRNAGGPAVYDAHLSSYDYPYPVHYFDIEVQRQPLRMAFMDLHPASEEPVGVVVLMHGKNFNGAYWQTTAEALRTEGFRVVIPDQIGFGKSSKPQQLQYSFHGLAHNTRALLHHLEIDSAAVVGHSMGGMLAARFELMYPQLVSKLVLVNPIGLEDYQKFFAYHPVEHWYSEELKKDATAIKNYQLHNYYHGQWHNNYQPWVDVLAGWTRSPDYPLVAWNAALTFDMIYTQPVVENFTDITSPTLLVIGTRDRTALGKNLVDAKTREKMGLYQTLGKQAERVMPNAQLVELADTGHLPHIEAFERFSAPLIQFLRTP